MIGRDGEARGLASALAAARDGRGATVFVLGEAGVGKSRLAREAERSAEASGMCILRGRAVEGGRPGPAVAYRPMAEALMSAVRRDGPPVDIPELRPFQPILARLIPEWRKDAGRPVDESLVLLSEAVLRLLRVMGSSAEYRGCLLVLEDLHWADAESLAVVEYLAANLAAESLVMVATSRTEWSSPAVTLARSLADQRLAHVVELPRLTAADVRAMASACLDDARVPHDVDRLLEGSADGLPLLVEELLAAWTDAGALVQQDGAWHVHAAADPVVPVSFVDSVRRRLQKMGGDATRVMRLAAILGRQFEWELLAPASGLEEERVLDLLRIAVDAQLVSASGSGFAFRHALTRDAVLEDLLPAERARQSARLLEVMEMAHPTLEGESTELAATLAEAAGKRHTAARLLLESGRGSLGRGALASAAKTLERARDLAAGEAELEIDIEQTLLGVLADSGNYTAATEVGNRLLRVFGGRGSARLRAAEVHLTLASVSVAASRSQEARQHVAAAGELDRERVLEARLNALAAHVAIDERHTSEAERLAQAALTAAERLGQVDVACEALIVIGRLARAWDLDRAAEAFQRAHDLAQEHRLTVWRGRALHELGTIDMFRDASPVRLLAARQLALDSGALATAAWVDGELSALFNTRFEMERSLEFAEHALAAGRRYRLLGVQAMALTFIAEVHAYRQDRREVERIQAELAQLERVDPWVEEVAWECRAIVSLLEEDRPRAIRELDNAVRVIRAYPMGAPGPSLAMWALNRVVDGPADQDVREELRASPSLVNLTNRGYLAYADAVYLGHQGQPDAALAMVARGDRDLEAAAWYLQYGRRLVAEAALRDGWGEPAVWLREAAEFFSDHGYEAVASACRSLLRKAGDPGGRRRAHRGVPPPFRQSGVTERELEVLALVADGLSNRDIGRRLYLSPKTVEKHVASLMDKLEVRTRAQLASIATAHRLST